MGYLDSTSITVDAILTKNGRKKLAQGQGLGITKFALADDGIDYDLWNPDHPSGSVNYGNAITSLPMLEATPDDSTCMKYKLNTLNRATKYLPILRNLVDIGLDNQGIEYAGEIRPRTGNFDQEQYEFLFTDMSAIYVTGGTLIDISAYSGVLPSSLEMPQAGIMVADSVTITAQAASVDLTTICRVTGLNSGAYGEVAIKITANQ